MEEAPGELLALEQAVVHAVKAARDAWPDLRIDHRSFAEYLVARLPAPTCAALASLHVSDLFLAWACSQGDRRALSEFERRMLAPAGKYVGRFDPSPSFVDDVRQEVREKLFMRRRRVQEYRGRGPLAAWVRVTAVRAALNMRRGREAAREPLSLDTSLAGPGDPEIDYLHAISVRDFSEAFHQAIAELPQQEREVLRLHYLEGQDKAEIAARYGVHRTTISRAMARSREMLMHGTRRLIAERLGIELTEEDFAMLRPEDVDVRLTRM